MLYVTHGIKLLKSYLLLIDCESATLTTISLNYHAMCDVSVRAGYFSRKKNSEFALYLFVAALIECDEWRVWMYMVSGGRLFSKNKLNTNSAISISKLDMQICSICESRSMLRNAATFLILLFHSL